MTIFVIGGAGFLGANFVLDSYAQREETAVIIDKLTYTVTFVIDRPGHDRRYAIYARKTERELDRKPAPDTFETGIRKTVQWNLDNPGWIANVQSGAYREWVSKQYKGAAA